MRVPVDAINRLFKRTGLIADDTAFQFGIPNWVIENLGLPKSTQRVVIVASNRDFMLVSAKFYAPVIPKKGGRK